MDNYLAKGLIVGSLLCLIGCEERLESGQVNQDPIFESRLESWKKTQSQRFMQSTINLCDATDQYLKTPDSRSQQQLQQNWRTTHDHYLRLAVLVPENVRRIIDPWPIFPGFIDNLPNYPSTGIVNDITLEITDEMLRQQHMITSEEEVSVGFHVLEYYAYARPFEDLSANTPNADRRRGLIEGVCRHLLTDAEQLIETLELTSLPRSGLLSTLWFRSQRIFSEHNRSGEHSQFSNLSTENIWVQLRAIEDLLDSGPVLNQWLLELSPQLATALNDTLKEAIELSSPQKQRTENEEARLVLLLSAITHQFEDLNKICESQGQ